MGKMKELFIDQMNNQVGASDDSYHYEKFKQEKEIVESVNIVNKARSSIGGKLLSDIYINRDLEEHLEMAHEDSVLTNVIVLLQENKAYPRILRPAMASLANLSERVECHPYLRKHQIHNLILEFFKLAIQHIFDENYGIFCLR